jgi:GNAT superfamily N-acetyltransferase
VTGKPQLVIEPLHPEHDREGFACGVPALDRYLQRQAGQDVKRRFSRVFICVEQEVPQRILGFYTLSALSIETPTLPIEIARRFPKYPLPAALLGRLAVAESALGGGIGRLLLMDAIQRTRRAAQEIAVYALVVDAKDERAASFYRHHDFLPFPDRPLRLFLPLA